MQVRSAPITGKVTVNGRGFPNLTVTNDAYVSWAITDANGNYSLPNIPGRTKLSVVEANGLKFSAPTSAVPGYVNVDFQVLSGPIGGKVTLDGAPFTNVPVRVFRSQDPDTAAALQEVRTNSSGRFWVPDLHAAETYRVLPVLDGFSFDPPTGQSGLSVGLATNVLFKVKTGPIAGYVKDGSGIGKSGVTIVISANGFTRTVTTRPSPAGYFIFTNLPAGTNYVLRPQRLSGLELHPTRPDYPVGETNVQILAGYSILGKVSSLDSGAGVEGVLITVTNGATTKTNTTTADGQYVVSGLSNTTYTVTASSPGLDFPESPPSVTLEVRQTNVNFTARALLSGRVTNVLGGIPEITITATDTDGKTTGTAITDAGGRYKLPFAVNAAQMILTPSKSGYTFAPASRPARPGPTGLNQDFGASGGIAGRITYQDGSGVPGIVVTANTNPGGGQFSSVPQTTTTDANGVFQFGPIFPEGTGRLTPERPGYTFDPPSITTNTDVPVNFRVAQSPPTISPVPELYIARNASTGPIPFTITDREGLPTNAVRWKSSDTNLVPNSAVAPTQKTATPTNQLWQVTVAPAANLSGTASITLTVDDGNGGTDSTRFVLNVDQERGYWLTNGVPDTNQPATIVGQAVPAPTNAAPNRQPQFEIMFSPPEYAGLSTNFYIWSQQDRQLFPVADGIKARIHWYTNYFNFTDLGTTTTTNYTVWPRQPQVHVVGAPVDIEPLAVLPSFPYRFFAVAFSTAGVRTVGPASKLFNAAQPGYSVLQYFRTDGDPLNPPNQHVLLKVVKSFPYDDRQFRLVERTTPWDIGQAIALANRFATAEFSGYASNADFEIVGRAPGANRNGLNVRFQTRLSQTNAVKATYDEASTNLTITLGPSPLFAAGDIIDLPSLVHQLQGTNRVFNLFGLTNNWKYRQDTNLDSVPTWKDPGFNDSDWPEGPGALGYDTSSGISNAFLRTPLSDPNVRIPGETVLKTYYFRTTFEWNNTLPGGMLILSNKIDDGAVFYLNGEEIVRFNMPTGSVSYATRAPNMRPAAGWNISPPTDGGFTTNDTDVSGWDWLILRSGKIAGILKEGTNVLAVSLHQPATSSDAVFGAELYGSNHVYRKISEFLLGKFSDTTRGLLAGYPGAGPDPVLEQALMGELNQILRGSSIYDAQRFTSVSLSADTLALLALNPQGEDLVRLNRLLLQDAYPLEFADYRTHAFAATAAEIIRAINAVSDAGFNVRYEARLANGQDGSGAVNRWIPGRFFNGVDDSVALNLTYSIYPGFQMDTWIYPVEETTNNIFSGNYYVGVCGTKVIAGYFDDSGQQNRWVSANNAVAQNAWNHIAVTFWGGRPFVTRFATDGTFSQYELMEPEVSDASEFPRMLSVTNMGRGFKGVIREATFSYWEPAVTNWNPFWSANYESLTTYWTLPDPQTTAGGQLVHDDYPGRNGFVLFSNALYDGAGSDRAYDRATRKGPIIPVNRSEPKSAERFGTGTGTNAMVVVWYLRDPMGVAWASNPRLYDPQWPTNAETLWIFALKDQPARDPALFPNKRIYNEPDPYQPGFNPNEEHAAIFEDKVTALRDDLNGLLGLSQPFVLLKYQNPFTSEWQMKVFAVTHSEFRYPQQAAQEIQPPFPLYLLNLCPETTTWSGPLWRDYKGKIYAYAAGPGLAGSNAVIRYFYPLQRAFYYDLDGNGVNDVPAETCIPWLDRLPGGHFGTPVDVTYNIRWPDDIPTLQIGSTLLSARNGLPEVFSQARAEVLFEGVNPVYTTTGTRTFPPDYALNSGVRLYDPLSERVVSLPPGFVLPGEVETALEPVGGRKLFPKLPYHLRCRFLYDELDNRIIFRGFTIYKDQPPQDPLLLPNVMTDWERINLVGLVQDDGNWYNKVTALYHLTRNPNGVDIDGVPGPDEALRVGLTTNLAGQVVQESFGAGAKALTASLPLSDKAANLLLIPGPKQGVSLNGANAYLQSSNNLVGLSTGANVAHTLEVWVQPDAFPTGSSTNLLLYLGSGGKPQQWWIDSSKNVHFGGGTRDGVPSEVNAGVSTNWIHLASSYDGVWYRVYTNGALAGSLSNYVFNLHGVPLTVGRHPSGAAYFRGAVAELRLWNRARSAQDISSHQCLALRGNEPGLVAYWRTDESAGSTTAADASGHGNAGQVVSAVFDGTNSLVRQLNGYVTLAFNNDPTLPGLPVTLKVIQIDCSQGIYAGDLRVIASDNIFDERLTLRHSADFGLEPDRFEFQWYYHNGGEAYPIYDLNGNLANGWISRADFNGTNLNYITLGEGGESGVLTIADNRWIMRYRPTASNPMVRVVGTNWSDWAGAPNRVPKEAMLAEGWIKRVTDALNPFDARTDDFRNSEVNTYASLLVSAGRRYEGDIAFNPDADNVNKVGLIEAYQTVLNRGGNLSINNNIQNGPANEALLHAASKIADLYLLLGNEAYADAQDPTVGFTTTDGDVGSLAPSIFAFQNQTASLLEEELGLLRGLDQYLGRPEYNRLPWNFTGGEGQLAYVQVYNISDTQTRNPITGQIVPADGFIDVNDAAALYPQGHGDAWGHYLTALQTYYQLLQHTNFDWQARSENVLLAGVPIQVDYQDERKFATIASAKAKAGAEIVSLTYRQHYVDDPAGQWQGYKDTEPARAWGVDEWARRAGQGAYFDWMVANGILPAQDPDPTHQGIQKIDRTTVPELKEIVAEYNEVQSQIDSADVGLNPVGLAKGTVPFDIDPTALTAGTAHFDQIYQRAQAAMDNAVTVFNYANDLTRNLRRTQDSAADFAGNVADQERDYKNRLITILGYPYFGRIGPGKPYASGYDGPDLLFYNYVDESDLTGEKLPDAPTEITAFFKTVSDQITAIPDSSYPGTAVTPVSYPINDSPGAFWGFTVPAGSWGTRRAPGEIQTAISALLQTRANYEQALKEYDNLLADISQSVTDLEATDQLGADKITQLNKHQNKIVEMNKAIGSMNGIKVSLRRASSIIGDVTKITTDSYPRLIGFANDVFAPLRAINGFLGKAGTMPLDITADALDIAQSSVELAKAEVDLGNEIELQTLDNRAVVPQKVAELQAKIREEVPKRVALYALKENLAQQMGNYRAKLAEGLRLLEERDAFRKKTAGQVSQNRYRDLAFRVFRNDSIQKYRAQFDLAARYAYLAATAYDYETTMLGNQTGAGRQFLTEIVKQRALGEWVDGRPVVGRHGLADSMGRLAANWTVLKSQLGINNPEHEDGFFSLQKELFRDKPLFSTNANLGRLGDEDWQRVLKRHVVPNLWDIPEFRRYCRSFAPESAGPQPGLVIPFSTTITFGMNYFGWPLGAADGAYDSSRFATKVKSAAILFNLPDDVLANLPISRTPRVYLVPVGTDILRCAAGNTTATREFKIVDQKIPMPFPIGYSDVNNPNFIPENDSLGGSFIEIRRYSTFHAFLDGPEAFDPGNDALTESRLIGRSVWNTRWLLIIPGGTFLYDPNEGLDTFISIVPDITLYFRTYSYSGN